MRVLVLGATGYIGSAVARALAEAGHAVTGVSRSAAGDAIVSAAGAVPLRGDLADPAALAAAMPGHDATVCCAQLDLESEFAAMRALLAAVPDPAHGVLFTSGTGVLAQRTDGEWSEDSFAEDEPFVPARTIIIPKRPGTFSSGSPASRLSANALVSG